MEGNLIKIKEEPIDMDEGNVDEFEADIPIKEEQIEDVEIKEEAFYVPEVEPGHTFISPILIKPFSCETCNFKYTSEVELKRHKMRAHTVNPSFICDVCNKKFLTARDKAKHLKIHIEKLICEYCEAVFLHGRDLKYHISKNHPGESSLRCYSCNAEFVNESAMEKHINSRHPGKKTRTMSLRSSSTRGRRKRTC